ncbi:hypothetical protein K438DRAFT_1880537 [Mycena galopus ATCC 62051]|nr:hypothetical protein K438DRAFT_1880537 [Mycena galopus ATCC 62051]
MSRSRPLRSSRAGARNTSRCSFAVQPARSRARPVGGTRSVLGRRAINRVGGGRVPRGLRGHPAFIPLLVPRHLRAAVYPSSSHSLERPPHVAVVSAVLSDLSAFSRYCLLGSRLTDSRPPTSPAASLGSATRPRPRPRPLARRDAGSSASSRRVGLPSCCPPAHAAWSPAASDPCLSRPSALDAFAFALAAALTLGLPGRRPAREGTVQRRTNSDCAPVRDASVHGWLPTRSGHRLYPSSRSSQLLALKPCHPPSLPIPFTSLATAPFRAIHLLRQRLDLRAVLGVECAALCIDGSGTRALRPSWNE